MAKVKLQLKGVVERGNALFEKMIKPLVQGMNPEDFVAVDVKSGKFAVASTSVDAFARLEKLVKKPDAFLRKVGSKYAVKFGGRPLRPEQ